MGERAGRDFQRKSKYVRGRMEPHELDWENQPSPYKEYPEAPELALPEPAFPVAPSMKDLVGRRRSVRVFSTKAVTLEELSALLWASAGITKVTANFEYRAAPSAGALYPIETYLVVNRVEELPPGVYHYSVRGHSVRQLKKGDFAADAAAAALDQEMARKAPVVFAWTAVFGRSAWKYRERAYRYVYLDCGHIAGQLSLAAAALGLGSCSIAAIYDDEANALLGVDGEDESVLYMCVVGVPR